MSNKKGNSISVFLFLIMLSNNWADLDCPEAFKPLLKLSGSAQLGKASLNVVLQS